MAEQNPFPPMDTAPYWRPIAPDELGLILNAPPEPGDLDLAEGWVLALFSIGHPDHTRTTVWGWVKGSFGVWLHKMDVGPLGNITHLPTGARIGLFLDEEEAAFAADSLEPVLDWSAVTPSMAGQIGSDVHKALRSSGFQRAIARAEGVAEAVAVWARLAGSAH